MKRLVLIPELRTKYSEYIAIELVRHPKALSRYLDTLLKVVDVDIHAVKLSRYFDKGISSSAKLDDVEGFLRKHPESVIDVDRVSMELYWHFVPRAYVLIATNRFGGKRLDEKTIMEPFSVNPKPDWADEVFFNRLLKEGYKRLSILSKQCDDDDWLYDVSKILNIVQQNLLRKLKPNSFSLFENLVDGIGPMFIDEPRTDFGRWLSVGIMVGGNDAGDALGG